MSQNTEYNNVSQMPQYIIEDMIKDGQTITSGSKSRIKRVVGKISRLPKKLGYHEQFKLIELEKNNNLLFRKIAQIMKRKRSSTRFHHKSAKKPKANNEEEERISRQNQILLKKLSEQRSALSVERFQQERRNNFSCMKRISKYVKPLPIEMQKGLLAQNAKSTVNQTLLMNKIRSTKSALSNYKHPKSFELPSVVSPKEVSFLQNHKIYLWKGLSSVDGAQIELDIIRIPNNYEIIARIIKDSEQQPAPKNNQGPGFKNKLLKVKMLSNSLSLLLSVDEGNNLLSENDYQYKQIAKLLRFKQNKLSILMTKNNIKQYYLFENGDRYTRASIPLKRDTPMSQLSSNNDSFRINRRRTESGLEDIFDQIPRPTRSMHISMRQDISDVKLTRENVKLTGRIH